MRCASTRSPAPAGLKPYLHVRRDLWAKVTRALFYDLVALGEERDVEGRADVRRRLAGRVLRDGAGRCREGVRVTDAALPDQGPVPGHEFFALARERLTFDISPALTDPDAPVPRGDHDLDPVIRTIADIRPIRPAAVLIPVVDHDEPTVLLTLRTGRHGKPCRAGRVSRRQDRSRRRDADGRRFARGRGGNRPRPQACRAARLSRPLSFRHRLPHRADGRARRRPASR